MKKRVVSAVASMVLASVMAVGFVACKKSAKEISGDKNVTKETWETALKNENRTNYELELKQEIVTKFGDMCTVTQTLNYTISVDGTKEYAKGTMNTEIEGTLPDGESYQEGKVSKEYYASAIGDYEYEFYDKDDSGAWRKLNQDAAEGRYMSAYGWLSGSVTSMEYEDYEYKDEEKGYVYKGSKDGKLFVIKIKDGELRAVYTKETITEGVISEEVITDLVFTYGKESVQLPAV